MEKEEKIRQICSRRNIKHLFHFTNIENLKNILKKGLLSRKKLYACNIKVKINDILRYDGMKDYINVSISFPNYKMFYKIRMHNEKEIFAVLILDHSILWKLECAFCHTNAASKIITYRHIEERKTVGALVSMFDKSISSR